MSTVDKSRNPYFDDHDESKNFHEVLFVPARSVQIRELNQLQSLVKTQIERFGNHVFKEGSIVVPGEINYDMDTHYVTSTVVDLVNVQELLQSDDLTILGSNGISANVKLYVVEENGDPNTFYIEYLNSSTDGLTAKFAPGDEIEFRIGAEIITTGVVGTIGLASRFTINDGVYYLGGRFCLVEKETVLLEKYGNSPSAVVCIEYNEVVVTENDDSSLFDNAQGTTNFTAPGAHRLRVNTNLAVYALSELDNLASNNIEIFRIENGVVQKKVDTSQYQILGDTLAQRTYEESGDYSVKAFGISFKEHATDPDKFITAIESGLAYVRGYRVENLSTLDVNVDKARTTSIINNSSISAAIGHYVLVDTLNIIPNVSQLQKVTFYSGALTTAGAVPSGSVLGSARVRFVRRDGANYRLHLFDIRDTTGKATTGFIFDALSIYSSEGTAFTASLVESFLFNPIDYPLIFMLNVEDVKSLNDEFGVSDTSFSSVRQINQTTDSNGLVTVSAASNEVFISQNSDFAFASFTDSNEFIEVAGNFSLSGTPTGSTITFDFGIANAARPVRINAQVAKEQVSQKTKTVQTTTVVGTPTAGVLSLAKADVFEIVSVLDDDLNDVTDKFTLVENKTLDTYFVSYVTTTETFAAPVTVEFKYFQHSAGDYFGPDSYVDVDYEDIPSEGFGRLSDVLDFRPRISDDGTSFTGSGSVVGSIPTPFSIIRSDVEHYLPRRDKVYVNKKGVFGVSKGVPSLNPKLPEDPADSMVIYELYVPAYTSNVSRIDATKVKNRRYTMKDIGKLDQRLSNVEYYVSLNLLEQDAENKQVFDPVTGLTRFKNGFLTDPFVDHSVGDYGWTGYHIAVDDMGGLRPEFSLNAVDMEFNQANSSNISVSNGIVTLPYTEETYLRQNLRSTTMNVNPYAVFRWDSDIRLSPSADSWIDTVYTDPQVTYRIFNNGRLTQTWNSWQLNWTGGSDVQIVTDSRVTESKRVSNPHRERAPDGALRQAIRTFETTQTVTSAVSTRTNIDIVNDKLLDTSVVPYMRSTEITIDGEGNRPRTKMNFFFDNVNINNYVKPIGGNFGENIITNDDGDFTAVFRIPNSVSLRFRTGEKQLIVTDQENNQRELSTSFGSTIFTSTGIRQIRRQTIIATREITQNILRQESNVRQTSIRWVDPLAQSFLVEQTGGVFVTSINLFFRLKDEKVPLTVEIREMENGAPTQRQVPGAKKILHPSAINVSENGSLGTTFTFPYPVYLQDGNEYCFVVLSNSNKYEAWVAKMGELDLGTQRAIAEQPYNGVLFKSQNNSTWTPDQTTDMMFEIKRAEFNTNVVGLIELDNSDFEPVLLDVNPIQTTNASNELVVMRRGHNYVVGATVLIAGATAGNGIPDTDINTQHNVTSVTPNSFTVTVGSVATASGFIGSDNVTISNMVQASILNPNIPAIEFGRTSLSYSVRGTSGKSINGSETPYIIDPNFYNVSNNEINELPVPWLVTNRNDETENMLNQRSMKMRIEMRSELSNISPVIDLDGANIITPFNLITKESAVVADGENNYTNYRTVKTGLQNPADTLRLYLDIEKPAGSDVVISARTANTSEELNDGEWTVFNPISVNSAGADGFFENEYELAELDDFVWFQIMIQLKSDNACRVPICKNLRVLGLSA